VHLLLLLRGKIEKFAALKVPRQCPVVILVKVGWERAKALGSEARGMWGVCSRIKKLSSDSVPMEVLKVRVEKGCSGKLYLLVQFVPRSKHRQPYPMQKPSV
jgi:hypothetical protein